jgi:predicted acylesterase/phospholipase RssA
MQLIILLFVCLIDAKSNFNQTINYASHFKAKPEEKYCYALALSGGGSHGCYETGVIWGLLHYGDPDNYRWDVISGVSAGSI